MRNHKARPGMIRGYLNDLIGVLSLIAIGAGSLMLIDAVVNHKLPW